MNETPFCAHALLPGAVFVAVLPQFVGLVRRRVAQLIGQNQQNVRATGHDGSASHRPRPHVIRIGVDARLRKSGWFHPLGVMRRERMGYTILMRRSALPGPGSPPIETRDGRHKEPQT